MTKPTLRDLEAMRQHYGIAHEQPQEAPDAPARGRTDDLLEDLGQVGRLEEVGITLERWARLRGFPMEYAEVLRAYLDQEEEERKSRKRRTEKGTEQ
jgi:hypothetical protein